ncbi:MAG: nickel pincer cofactor biosynthesis protein LarB, partial [Nitrosotalea sp.]
MALDLTEILKSLDLGKISVPQAKKLLSLYSVEKIEDFAKIDMNRKLRRGIPEVVFAEKKELVDIKKIILTTTSKADSVLVSRINKDHYKKILIFSRKNKLKIHTGKNTTTILFSAKLHLTGGKVGIL